MSDTKWSSSPWEVAAEVFVDDSDGNTICLPNLTPVHEQNIANAHLIAAAPELYAALEEYVDTDETNEGTEGNEYFDAIRNRARAALAKARGEVA